MLSENNSAIKHNVNMLPWKNNFIKLFWNQLHFANKFSLLHLITNSNQSLFTEPFEEAHIFQNIQQILQAGFLFQIFGPGISDLALQWPIEIPLRIENTNYVLEVCDVIVY